MTEFTVVNPRKRSRSQSIESTRDENLTSEDAQEPTAKKQKTAEESEADSDKENSPKTPRDEVDQPYQIYYGASNTVINRQKAALSESRVVIEVEYKAASDFLYGPSTSLIRDDSCVPEHLRLKKYDTKPPPLSRDHILAASERLVSAKNKRALEPDYPDTDSKYSHSRESTPKRRKGNTKQPHHVKPSRTFASPNRRPTPGDIKSDTSPKKTVVDGRTMITTTKIASKMQKLVPGFPLPQDPFPEDFTLTELCTQYPNHIFGDNLSPFLQHEWSATKIAKLLPDQSQVAEKDQVTANAIASRLRKSKLALEKSGTYNTLMAAPKTHNELWNNVSEREGASVDAESEDDLEQTEDDTVSNDEDEDED